jgi:hypothetical protein
MFDFALDRPKARPTTRVAFDTETFLLGPCVQAPPVVAMGFRVDGGKVNIIAANDTAFDRVVESLFSDRSVLLVAHNARFDVAVLLAHGARFGKAVEWAQMILGAAHDDRVVCTVIRESLLRIAVANPMKMGLKFDLGTCCAEWATPTQPDKTDPWRLKWGTLADCHAREYPADAAKYLVEDVRAVDELYLAQNRKAAWCSDQYRQTRASIALALMSAWGFRTDPIAAQRLVDATEADLAEAAKICTAHGLMRPDGTRNKKAAEARMVAAFEARGLAAPRGDVTEKMAAKDEAALGNVKLDDEACALSQDPVLVAYSKASQATTLLSKAQRFLKPVLQPMFQTLVSTGRTSCSQGADPKPGEAPTAHAAQLQNLPRAEGARECLVARAGRVLCSVDYDSFEMSSWAQVCLDMVGHSVLAQILADPKRDMHVEMAAEIHGMPAADVYALKKTDPKRYKEIRQIGKPANFGLPGGLGAERFVDFARTGYGLTLTTTQAREVKLKWAGLYAEAKPYFAIISERTKGGRYRMTQLRSGRVRGGVGYTDCCNGYFQGLAADAAKEALWRLALEMYATPSSPLHGARAVNFIHDEVILEIPREKLHEAAERQAKVMVGAAQAYMPDVRVSASPAAMLRWTKGADAAHKEGRLVPWEER